MSWIVLAGSLVAVLALAGLAKWMGLGGGTIADAQEAAQAAADQLSGFDPIGALVSDDDLAAIVAGAGGRVAVVKRHGAHPAVREVGWSAVRSTAEGIEVATGDRRFGTVTLAGVTVLDVRRLAPQLTQV